MGRPPGRLRPGDRPPTGRQLGTFPTKRAARTHQKALSEGRAGTEGESLGDFLEIWLRSKEGRVAVSTYDPYAWAVRRHITPLVGAVRLRDLTADLQYADRLFARVAGNRGAWGHRQVAVV